MGRETSRSRLALWVVAGGLTVALALLVLTFPTLASGCTDSAAVGGDGCADYLWSWNRWVRFPYSGWLPWMYSVAILGLIAALVLLVRRALSRHQRT